MAALDELWSPSGGGDQIALIDTIEDEDAPDPEVSLEQTEMREALGEAIARLPEREKLVVTLYYYEELTLREIGEVLGVTESRVSQLHTKAVLRLKARLRRHARDCRDVGLRSSALTSQPRCALSGSRPTRTRTSPPRRNGRPWPQSSPERSATSPSSATAERARRRSSRRCCSRPTRSTGSGRSRPASTVADWDEDEQKRRMSISLTLTHTSWQGRKINLIDVPGDPSFQGEARCALRVVEGALVVVNAVMGLEVGTARVKHLADDLGLARVLFVNMLDRERADFYRTLAQIQEQFSSRCVAVHLPIGAEHELTGIVDVLHMCAYTSPDGGKEAEPSAIPDEMLELAQEYREKLLDEVVQTDEALMEQYLGGEELDSHAVAAALKLAITRGEVFPVACGVATKNLGTHALLDLIVEGVPSPAKKGAPIEIEGADDGSLRLQDGRRPVRRPDQPLPRPPRARSPPTRRSSTRAEHAKERMGTLLQLQGKEHTGVKEFGEGDIGAVAKLKDVRTGDLLTDREIARDAARDRLPGAGDELRDHAEDQGRGGEGRLGDPAARGGGPDARGCGATSRPARRSSRG